MASIVEWQSLKMQEYRYSLLVGISRFWQLFGINRPVRYDPPIPAGDYNHALHVDHPSAFSARAISRQPTHRAPAGRRAQADRPREPEGKDE